MWRLAGFLTAGVWAALLSGSAEASPARRSPLLLQTHRAGRLQQATGAGSAHKNAVRSGLKRRRDDPLDEDDDSSEEAAQSEVVQKLSGEIEGMRKQLQLLGQDSKVQAVDSAEADEAANEKELEEAEAVAASSDADESYEADEEEQDEAEEEDQEDEAEKEEEEEQSTKFNDDPARFGMYDMETGHADILDAKDASQLLLHEQKERQAMGEDDSNGQVLSESEEAETEDNGDFPESDGSDSKHIFGADEGENEYDASNEMGMEGAFAGEKPDYEGPSEVSGSEDGTDLGGNELDS